MKMREHFDLTVLQMFNKRLCQEYVGKQALIHFYRLLICMITLGDKWTTNINMGNGHTL